MKKSLFIFLAIAFLVPLAALAQEKSLEEQFFGDSVVTAPVLTLEQFVGEHPGSDSPAQMRSDGPEAGDSGSSSGGDSEAS